MTDSDKLRAETLDYLRDSINGDHYLEHLDKPVVLRELTQRILNARGWHHSLPDFGAVEALVRDVAHSFKKTQNAT